MNRYFLFTLLFYLIILCNLSHPLSLHAAISEAGNDFLFFYGNDVHGETEPCG